MGIIAGIETAMGCYPWNISHCPCVFAALKSMFKFYKAAKKWGNTLKGLESQFNKGVEGLKKMADSLHQGQINALKAAKGELAYGFVMSSLKSTNAPKSSYAMALASPNVSEFTCTLEGTDFDSCNDSSRSKSSIATRSIIMQNTANATRPLFDRVGVSASMVSHSNFRGPMNPDVPKNALSDGNFTQFFFTRARVGQTTSSGSNNGHQAKNVGAGNLGIGVATVIGFKHSPPVPMVFNGSIYSGSPNGHSNMAFLSNPHTGTHDKFKGVDQQDPCGDSNCFVNFNASSDANKDFGQPSVYGGVSQSLRTRQAKDGSFVDTSPWDVNSNGEVKIEMVQGQPATVKIVPRGNGIAVAKAKVYFHQMGDWKMAPNFFDPFWRAKLHFFKKSEFQNVLTLAGDGTGVALLSSGAPVEGVE